MCWSKMWKCLWRTISEAWTQFSWMCECLFFKRNLPVTSQGLLDNWILPAKPQGLRLNVKQLHHIFSVFERKGGKGGKSVVKDGSNGDWCLRKRPEKFYKLEEFLTRLKMCYSLWSRENFKIPCLVQFS